MGKGTKMKIPEYLNASFEGDDLFTGDQLRKAILDEREECAKLCEKAHWSLDDRNEYAAAIRARGNND